MIKRIPRDPPLGYEEQLSDYGPWLRDGNCGKTIGWGFEVVRYLGEERFSGLRKFGNLECTNGPHITDTTWYLIVDWLTPSEAIQEYGEIAQVVLGPHKGFRSVTFGKTTFISSRLNPLVHAINVPQEKISILPKGDRRLVINETK